MSFISLINISFRTCFLALNVLMYRMKLRNFSLVQPVLLAALIKYETDVCRWAAKERPEMTSRVYGDAVLWLQVLAGSVHPAISTETAPKLSGLEACRQVHLFVMFFTGFIFPVMLIWRLEKQTWKSFLRLEPEDIECLVVPPPQRLPLRLMNCKRRKQERSDLRIRVCA